MAYSELIKNFEKIRQYMRDFYVYGFKSRSGYDAKSPRSYDDERRRIESWLGDYMGFSSSAEGKNVFISVDSQITGQNPLYKALKSKSFTDGDITLHFILFDILHSAQVNLTLTEIIEAVDGYLEGFSDPMSFEESTIRKKLKEYKGEGLVKIQKQGRKVFYSRSEDVDISTLSNVIDFYSEVAPCGVVGSFLQDKLEEHNSIFGFKHHYITGAIDSDVMALLFEAMGKGCFVTAKNHTRHQKTDSELRVLPLKIYISAQNGRQHLLAYCPKTKSINAYRLDYLSQIKICEHCDSFGKYRAQLEDLEKYMWGVNCRQNTSLLETVEFDICVREGEDYIVRRLEREKRGGTVTKLDDRNYRYSVQVFDTSEMVPWIRTFISRITRLRFSNRTVENRFKEDIEKMYQMYGLSGGDLQ